jgi:hypothetical protein
VAPAILRPLSNQRAVGDSFDSRRHGDLEGVRSLVERMVVRGEPCRCNVRLARNDSSVISRNESADSELVFDGLGNTVITDNHQEWFAAWQALGWRDGELAAIASPRRE